MKLFTFFISALTIALLLVNQKSAFSSILKAGDIAIIGISANVPKSFDFITLVEINAGTVIQFTDDAWIAQDSSFRGNEGILTYTFSADVSVGSVVHWEDGVDGFEKTGSFTLSGSGDNIICYQQNESLSFIYGIGWAKNQKGNWEYLESSSGSTSTSDIPTGLKTEEYTIVHKSNLDSYAYSEDALHNGSRSELLYAFSILSNFDADDENSLSVQGQSFSITGQKIKPETEPTDIIPSETGLAIYICPDGAVAGEVFKTNELFTSPDLNEAFETDSWDRSDTIIYLTESETRIVKKAPENQLKVVETQIGFATANEEVAVWYCNEKNMGISEECGISRAGTYYYTQTDETGCIQKSEKYHTILKATAVDELLPSKKNIYVDYLGRVFTTPPSSRHITVPIK